VQTDKQTDRQTDTQKHTFRLKHKQMLLKSTLAAPHRMAGKKLNNNATVNKI